MARPSNRAQPQVAIPLIIPEGLSAKKIEFEPAEDPKERDLRFWKEKWSFLVNDLLASIVAFAALLGLVVFSFVTLVRTSSTPDDKKSVTSMLAAVGTAVAGFVFGRDKK